MPADAGTHPKVTRYFVNGEEETTTDHKLTVTQILEGAGFTPATEYRLTRDEGHHDLNDYDEEAPIHEGERFTATFLGPTPVS
jgi:hypothetical protein